MKYIYLVTKCPFDDEERISVFYCTDNLTKAKSVERKLSEATNILDLEEYQPETLENCWENIGSKTFEEFKDLFYTGLTEDLKKRLGEDDIEITDDLLYRTWKCSQLGIGYDEYEIKTLKFEEPFEDIYDLVVTPIEIP